jgi:iron complex outermembrane receptor protein
MKLFSAQNSYKNMQAGTSIVSLDSMAIAGKISGNLAELLAQSSTVYIKSAGGGSVATASMRGTGASHTSLIWNDMPINSPMTGQADFSLIPVYFIDEANILLGAASLLHVGGALGGGVAVENKPDWDSGIKVKTIQGVGSFNSYTSFGQVGWSGNKVSVKIRSFYEKSENNFKYYNSAPNVDAIGYYHQKNAGYSKGGLLTETYLRLNDRSLFSLKYWIQNREANIPKLLSSSPKKHKEKQNDKNQRLVASWKSYGDRWVWETMAGYTNDITGYFLQNINSGSSSVVTNFDTDNQTHLLFSQIQTQYDIKDQLRLNLQVSDNYSIAQSTDHVHFLDYRAGHNEFSFLASAYKSFGKQWIFSFLLRQHLIDNKFIKPIPSAGAEYFLSNQVLSFRVNIARNYHHPSLNDLYYQPGGNKNLRPEEGTTGEFGLSAMVKKLRIDVNSYYSIINDWILWGTQPVWILDPQKYSNRSLSGCRNSFVLEKRNRPLSFLVRCKICPNPYHKPEQ